MFCPNCSQEKVSPDTNFCSRCGYLLSGTAELLQTGGVPVAKGSSPMSRARKQAIALFLLILVIPPLIAWLALALGYGDYLIPLVLGSAVILAYNGLLRLRYAKKLNETSPAAGKDDSLTAAQPHMAHPANLNVLPQQQSYPVRQYTRRKTNDLEPRSVTEGTTKLLEKEKEL